MMRLIVRLRLYRPLMKLAHRFNWHYAPPTYPEGDTVLWCQWCGLRYTKYRKHGFNWTQSDTHLVCEAKAVTASDHKRGEPR